MRKKTLFLAIDGEAVAKPLDQPGGLLAGEPTMGLVLSALVVLLPLAPLARAELGHGGEAWPAQRGV